MMPEHLSYSTWRTVNRCERSYYLSKVANAPGMPAWYFAIGTAVHQCIERIAAGDDPSPAQITEVFYAEVTKLMTINDDVDAWLAGGSPEDPTIKDKATAAVLQAVGNARTFLKDVRVQHVELDVTGFLPGCELPIKGYVDMLGEHTKRGPLIIDWKSGNTRPANTFQLETYRALLMQRGMDEWKRGMHVMVQKPLTSRMKDVDLTQVDRETIGRVYQGVADSLRESVWPARADFTCKFCTQKHNCSLMSGKRDNPYDKAHEQGIPY